MTQPIGRDRENLEVERDHDIKNAFVHDIIVNKLVPRNYHADISTDVNITGFQILFIYLVIHVLQIYTSSLFTIYKKNHLICLYTLFEIVYILLIYNNLYHISKNRM